MTAAVRRTLLACAALAALAGPPFGWRPAVAEPLRGSPLGLRTLAEHGGEGLLAQRTIEREWGLSDDSTYREVDLRGWRSEAGAMALSGAVPGAGQLYAGEGSGLWFLLAETAGWVGRTVTHRRAIRDRDDAAALVGDPYDTLSVWSFDRWERATGDDPAAIEALWTGDRESFYHVIQHDPQYRPGFSTSGARDDFGSLRRRSDRAIQQQRYFELGLWLNHVVSAVDALRAARFHNLPLRKDLELKLGTRTRGGSTGLSAALTRRF